MIRPRYRADSNKRYRSHAEQRHRAMPLVSVNAANGPLDRHAGAPRVLIYSHPSKTYPANLPQCRFMVRRQPKANGQRHKPAADILNSRQPCRAAIRPNGPTCEIASRLWTPDTSGTCNVDKFEAPKIAGDLQRKITTKRELERTQNNRGADRDGASVK